MVTGSAKTCELYSNQGVRLGVIGEAYKSWVWCVAARPNSPNIVRSKTSLDYLLTIFQAIGCQDGTVAYLQLNFHTVHALYKERYAYRENMTDVIIQHLVTDQRVRIKCRDVIQKIAIYKDRLAVSVFTLNQIDYKKISGSIT